MLNMDIDFITWGVSNDFRTFLMYKNLLLGSTFGDVMRLLGLLFLFCIVLLGAVLATKFIGNRAIGLRNNNIKIIETYRLSTSGVIVIAKIADKYMALAVCKEKITVLSQLDEENIIIPQAFNEIEGINFNEILIKAKDKITSNKKKVD